MLTKRSVCACVRIFWQMTFLPSWTHAVLSTSLIDRCYFHVRTCCYCCVHSKGCPETHHPLSPQERGRIRSGWGRLLFIVTNNSFFTSPWLHLLTLSLYLSHAHTSLNTHFLLSFITRLWLRRTLTSRGLLFIFFTIHRLNLWCGRAEEASMCNNQ